MLKLLFASSHSLRQHLRCCALFFTLFNFFILLLLFTSTAGSLFLLKAHRRPSDCYCRVFRLRYKEPWCNYRCDLVPSKWNWTEIDLNHSSLLAHLKTWFIHLLSAHIQVKKKWVKMYTHFRGAVSCQAQLMHWNTVSFVLLCHSL